MQQFLNILKNLKPTICQSLQLQSLSVSLQYPSLFTVDGEWVSITQTIKVKPQPSLCLLYHFLTINFQKKPKKKVSILFQSYLDICATSIFLSSIFPPHELNSAVQHFNSLY